MTESTVRVYIFSHAQRTRPAHRGDGGDNDWARHSLAQKGLLNSASNDVKTTRALKENDLRVNVGAR